MLDIGALIVILIVESPLWSMNMGHDSHPPLIYINMLREDAPCREQ